MDLTGYRGGKWLEAGRHVATIADFREFTANTGNKGVEISFETNTGGSKGSWMLVENCYWRLAKLCDAAHIPEGEMAKFNERNPVAWLKRHLYGKHVGIVVALQRGSDKYHEVADVFDPADHEQQSANSLNEPEETDESDNAVTPESAVVPMDDPTCPF